MVSIKRKAAACGLTALAIACGLVWLLRNNEGRSPEPGVRMVASPADAREPSSVGRSDQLMSKAKPREAANVSITGRARPAPEPSDARHAEGVRDQELGAMGTNPLPQQHSTPRGIPDGPPVLTLSQQARRFVEDMKGAAGPEMAEHGRTMLTSPDAVVRGIGAALLAEAGALDDLQMKAIAQDKELSVPLFTLEWLADAGRMKDAADLRDRLLAGNLSSEKIKSMLLAAALKGGGERAALDLLRSQLSHDAAAELYVALAQDANQSYALRMKAAMDMRDVLSFEAYRSTAAGLQASTAGTDPAWDEGARRLTERLQGPAEILQAPPSLTSSDVDEMLAREYPMMLEDLALRVEYLVSHTNSTVSEGTVSHLTERLKGLREHPLTDGDQAVVGRLEKILDRVATIEQERPAPPAQAPPLSPGSEQSDAGR